MSRKTTPQGGHIVIRSQRDDEGQSGVIVVSNTTPMEEIDGIYSANVLNVGKTDPERKRTTNRVASEVEKNVRIRTSRVPSARSQKSGQIPLSDVPTQKLPSPDEMVRSPSEIGRSRIRDDEIMEESKFQDYELNVEERLDLYRGEEDNYICYRFPHLTFCACGVDHDEIKNQPPVEVYNGIFISTLHQSLISKNLLRLGITHILNLSAKEFSKRPHYFQYLNFDIFDTHDEDIKKHFRITNRFIAETLQNGGKILVHSDHSSSRAPAFILAYLIGKKKQTLKNSLDLIKQAWPETEINGYFYKQLEQYDLEKLAIGSTIKV